MPKRKRSSQDIEYYKNKIKRYERKILKQNSKSSSPNDLENIVADISENNSIGAPVLRPEDWLLDWPEDQCDSNFDLDNQPGPSSATEPELDTEVLEILGEDPTVHLQFSPDIRSELATRLLHITKEGLNKESRKELILKYPLPGNCGQIDAPKINPEIKAAIADNNVKRDKGIESKQRQLASAIACLGTLINEKLNDKSTDHSTLQKLMDAIRILCDLQHADSITRRNFILYTLNNDMKECLKNTKINSLLFGDNLSETLKSAKAVNKSAVELKADLNKSNTNRPLLSNQRAGNRRALPQTRRPAAGRAPPVPRSRQPAAARAPPPPATHQRRQPPHASTFRQSLQAQQAPYPRRQY